MRVTTHKLILRSLYIVILLSILPYSNTYGQFVDLGQDPASTRWREIRTDQFQIIYPDFYEANAQRIANIYARLYSHSNSLGVKAKKMSMIIRANGAISNGNAGWAPKKSELYTTPTQDPSDEWLEHLAIHEFRHIVQYDKVNQGLSKVLYYIFGEQYTMALIGVYIPMWLLEGDATIFETAVGRSGRGRSPEFLNEIKAQMLEKGIYSYPKAVLGSYKDYIPDRYTLGYYMVSNSNTHYGKQIWQDVFTRVGRQSHTLIPFKQSIKLTHRAKRDSLWNAPAFRSHFINPDSVKSANNDRNAIHVLYRDNFIELQEIWREELSLINHNFDTLHTPDKIFTNYHYPIPIGDNHTITYKEGMAESGAFVTLKDGTEKLIFRPGIVYDHKFIYRDGEIFWTEYKPHPRWEHGGRMILASYDITSGTYRRYYSDNNCFAPFNAGRDIGFVEVDANNRSYIVILDVETFSERYRHSGSSGELFIHPSFSRDGRIITVVLSTEGKWIESIDPTTGDSYTLIERSDYEIDNPIVHNGELFYRASYNGNNAIYTSLYRSGNLKLSDKSDLYQPDKGELDQSDRYNASTNADPKNLDKRDLHQLNKGYLHRPDRYNVPTNIDSKDLDKRNLHQPDMEELDQPDMEEHFQLLEAKYGLRYPNLTPDGDTLYFSFYTADGYKPGRVAINQLTPKIVNSKPFILAEKQSAMESWQPSLSERDSTYQSRRYSKAEHLFNIHSWGPIFPDREDENINFGLAVSSQNKLNTLYWSAGYIWDDDYSAGCLKLNATYKGLWPIFNLRLRSGRSWWQSMDNNAVNSSTGKIDTLIVGSKATYTRLKGSIEFPFTLNFGNYFRGITPFFTYELHAIHNLKPDYFYRQVVKFGPITQWSSVDGNDYSYSNPAERVQIMQYGVRLYNRTRMSQRDIYPRWGQILRVGFQHTPCKTINYGKLLWGEGTLYFPGFAHHHSLYAYIGFQKQSKMQRYGNRINSPRGTKLQGDEIYSLRTSYRMPLAYPDLHLRSLAYIKRITGGIFYDLGKDHNTVSSFGMDMNIDSHFFTLTIPFNIGFRWGYETQSRSTFFNLLLSVEFSI